MEHNECSKQYINTSAADDGQNGPDSTEFHHAGTQIIGGECQRRCGSLYGAATGEGGEPNTNGALLEV